MNLCMAKPALVKQAIASYLLFMYVLLVGIQRWAYDEKRTILLAIHSQALNFS